MFVYGFGDYTRFVEVSCMSPHSRSRLSSTGTELIDRAIMVVLSRCRGQGACPGESAWCRKDNIDSIGILRREGMGNDKSVAMVRRLTCRSIVSRYLHLLLVPLS
jgi:hypothetical protein